MRLRPTVGATHGGLVSQDLEVLIRRITFC